MLLKEAKDLHQPPGNCSLFCAQEADRIPGLEVGSGEDVAIQIQMKRFVAITIINTPRFL